MKKIYIPLIILPLIACSSKKENIENPEARELFSQSSALVLESIRSIQEATDSVSVDSLSRLFEKKIVDINFSFPPNTDLHLTEQENDSLFKIMNEYKSVKETKLRDLQKIEKDSIQD